jgi:hypothetical protein
VKDLTKREIERIKVVVEEFFEYYLVRKNKAVTEDIEKL